MQPRRLYILWHISMYILRYAMYIVRFTYIIQGTYHMVQYIFNEYVCCNEYYSWQHHLLHSVYISSVIIIKQFKTFHE